MLWRPNKKTDPPRQVYDPALLVVAQQILSVQTTILGVLRKMAMNQQDLDAALTAEEAQEATLDASIQSLIAKFDAGATAVDLAPEVARLKALTQGSAEEEAAVDASLAPAPAPAPADGTTGPTV
jgi:hypothetical protein